MEGGRTDQWFRGRSPVDYRGHFGHFEDQTPLTRSATLDYSRTDHSTLIETTQVRPVASQFSYFQ